MNTSLLNSISETDIEKFKLLASLFNETGKINSVTLRVFEDEYLNFVKVNFSNSYFLSVQNTFKHLNDFFVVQTVISNINQKEAEQFMMYMQQKVKRGYRVYYRNLKAAFNKAVDWKYISSNPFIKIKLPKVQRSAPGFLNSDQLSVISDQIKNDTVKDIVKTAFYSGMRLNEVVNLKWRNVDLEKRIITIGDAEFTTKSRRQRFVPVCEELFEILVRRETEDVKETPSCVLPLIKGEKFGSFVFCKENGEVFTGDHVSKSFRKACIDAGINKDFHFHSLRHSFASNLVQKGVSLYLVKELLGHSSISTTEIYSHLNMESLREAVDRLNIKSEE